MRRRRYYAQWVWSIKKIHGCTNDCILYRYEFEEMHKFPKCGVSRDDDKCSNDESTKNGAPTKVSWYLPIISRFKCLFVNKDDAKDLT